jgi:putative ABC transport system ATP-binding protein
MGFIHLDHLTKTYLEGDRARLVLKEVSVDFDSAGVTAILGKSGSGKTTLLNLISGIDLADSGDIYVDGRRLTAMNDLERTLFRRENIGFIFQFFNLIPTLTVWENVTLPLELNHQDNAIGFTRAEKLLNEVGLLDRKNTFPDRLSGGEQQRVSIARALVHDPILVLADEPTGNLDEETGRHILELLDRLTRQAGKHLILVTHSQEAAGFADQVFTLHNGQLVNNFEKP